MCSTDARAERIPVKNLGPSGDTVPEDLLRDCMDYNDFDRPGPSRNHRDSTYVCGRQNDPLKIIYGLLSEGVLVMKREEVKLEDLVCMEKPRDVREEAERIASMMFPGCDLSAVTTLFADVNDLFRGRFPGYRECNIHYHDLKHTMDCFLAMTRLIHGAYSTGAEITQHGMVLGLISSLLHDTGYIQSEEDRMGTGAKYTLHHIERSIDFARRYLGDRGFSADEFRFCRDCMKCTGLDIHIGQIAFLSTEHELMGKMLGTADIVGQMADRTYLEKLPFLFMEFKEGGVPGFEDEFDLIAKTPDFWEFTKKRFSVELGGVCRFMENHFTARWGIPKDLYREAIDRTMDYLKSAIENHGGDPMSCFRRRHQEHP